MTEWPRRTVIAALLLSALPSMTKAAATAGSQPSVTADLVLLNGRIITVDANDSIAEAVAVKDGRILAVGSNRSIEALVGPKTERIDLGGLTATPGLLDAHCHFAAGAVDLLYVLDLSYPAVKKMDDVVASVQGKVAETKPGEWVVGRGWDEGKLAECGLGRKEGGA